MDECLDIVQKCSLDCSKTLKGTVAKHFKSKQQLGARNLK